MTIDWVQIIIALVAGAGGVGLWQFAIVNKRLDTKERQSIQTQWQTINTAMMADRVALQQSREDDRIFFQGKITELEVKMRSLREESTTTISDLRKDLRAAELRIRELEASAKASQEKINNQAEDIRNLKQQIVNMGGRPGVVQQGGRE